MPGVDLFGARKRLVDSRWDVAASLPVTVQEKTNGAVTSSYVYGVDLLSTTDNNNVTSYFLQDGLGSTTGLTNASGTVTDTVRVRCLRRDEVAQRYVGECLEVHG